MSGGVSGSVSSASPHRIAIVLFAAVADNGVIGRDNGLPFRQSSDLKRFKALTMGKPVLMGRKTYLSIGKPLPGRTNIVVSRSGFAAPGVLAAASLDKALTAARGDALRRGADEIVVIGGTDIFAQLMPVADRMEITHVHAQPAGDTYFPPIDAARWSSVTRTEHPAAPNDDAAFAYATYRSA